MAAGQGRSRSAGGAGAVRAMAHSSSAYRPLPRTILTTPQAEFAVLVFFRNIANAADYDADALAVNGARSHLRRVRHLDVFT